MSYVYFIAAEAAGMVKIGFATNPWQRFSKIQSDCPFALTMLGVEDGTKTSEKALHKLFAEDRLQGEWFALSNQIRAYAELLATPIRPSYDRPALGGALGAWMYKNGHTVRTAGDLFDLPTSTISRICAGKHIPRRDAVLRIYELTNREVSPNALYGIGPFGEASACRQAA